MTKIEVFKDCDQIKVIKITGHANYSQAGSDIVCAGVSAIIDTVVVGIKNQLGINVLKTQDEKNAKIILEVPEKLNHETLKKIDLILNIAVDGLRSLMNEYENFIEIKEK